MTQDLSGCPEEFRYLILALQRQANRQLNRQLACLGLTNSQAEAVEVLGDYGPLSTKDVGCYLVCESGSPSRLLASLASKGISVASQSSQDRRLTLHALTPKGRSLLTDIRSTTRDFEADLAERLNTANADNRGVIEVLTALVTDPDLTGALQRRFPQLSGAEANAAGLD